MPKISEYIDGGFNSAQDFFIVVRDGENRKVKSQQIVLNFGVNSGAATQSMCHLPQGVVGVGRVIKTLIWFTGHQASSGGEYYVAEVRNSEYVGTIGSFSSDGYIEGQWYRFAPILGNGNVVDIRKLGIQCAAGVTGWHSRFANIVTWCRANGYIMTGGGTLQCTETVDIRGVFFHGENLRFQGGTAQTSGGNFGATFFTQPFTNTQVTFTVASPGVVNYVGHGLSPGDQFKLGVSNNGRLPSPLAFLTTYYVKDVLDADTFTLSTSNGGAAVNITATGTGTYWLFRGGTQSNIETVDFALFNGKIARKGVIVKAGQTESAAIRDHMYQRVVVRGDGNFNWTTDPSTIGVLHCGDRGPHGRYDYSSNYSYVAVGSNTENEKHEVHVRSTYSKMGYYAFLPAAGAGTPDSMDIYVTLSDYQFAVYECEGLDSYIKYHMRCEPRKDPASDANNLSGDDAPCYLFRNGKCSVLSGIMRGHNGKNCIYVSGRTNTLGTSNRAWGDTFILDGFTAIHGYGTFLTIQNMRKVAGTLYVKDWANPNGAGQAAQPAFKINRVVNAAGLRVFATSIKNDVGLQIGETDYYSKDAHLGYWTLDMTGTGTEYVQFTTAGLETTPASSANPTALTAWEAVKAKNCHIDLSGSRGNGIIGGAVETTTFVVDTTAKLYSFDVDSNATYTLGYPTLSTSGLTIN